MEIGKIMQRLNESRTAEQQGIKTASAGSTGKTSSAETLRAALRETLATAPTTEKTAAARPAANPAGDLMKLAEDLTSAEEEALMKQAAVYGAAMCDGFMTRFAQYDEAAGQLPQVKTAAQVPVSHDPNLEAIKTAAAHDPEFVKFASENPDLVKEAVDLGYRQTMDQLVKTAEADYESGYTDTMQEMHKIASECYKAGAVTINNVLREMRAA